jgi:hypothetical protein
MSNKQAQDSRRGSRQRILPQSSANLAQKRSPYARIETVLAKLRILLPNLPEVRAYLRQHSDLAKLVPAVCAEARREFGAEAELTLQLYRDPEIKDRHLSLYVRLPSYNDGVSGRLDRATEPFEDELCNASGFLVVTTDFQTPRVKNAV